MFFLSSSADHRDLHSFPTRRSSDLRLRLQNDRIDARLQKLRTFRCKRFLDRLVANARRIEFGDIKMVAKKITGTAAIRSARRDGQTDQTGTAVMKIAVFRADGRCSAIGMMKTRANHSLFFAGSNNLVDCFGAAGNGKIYGRFHVTAAGLVFLRAEGWEI